MDRVLTAFAREPHKTTARFLELLESQTSRPVREGFEQTLKE